MYETVVSILHSPPYNWPADCAPAPEATAQALGTETPEQIVATLDNYVRGCMTGRRPDGLTSDSAWYGQLVHEAFAIDKEMYEYGTALALGSIVEPPEDKIAAARSLSEWRRNQLLGRSWEGYRLLDDTPEGNAEMERRKAKAADVPLEWAAAGKAEIWERCVWEGFIPSAVDALSAAYAVRYPSLDSVRNLDGQQFLDNLHAAKRHGNVRMKWFQNGDLNPQWKDD
ncbi:MAG TPA: hypothetical protein PKW35_08510 [Nannocystaceae bacterium]|nr:hypothetical protein [Nannocystaceae bacterium]